MAQEAIFTNMFLQLDKLGLLDSLIPFLLVFAITFATLEKAQIFGVGKKNINMIVSISLALMFVIPHIIGKYPKGKDPVEIINIAVPNVSMVAIAVVMALVLAGTFGFQFVGGGLTGIVLIFSLGAVAWFFGNAAGWWSALPNFSPETKSLVVTILVFGLIIFFITRDSKAENLTGWYKGLSNSLQKL